MSEVHDVPSEFKDEEKWLRFFPKRSFVILIVMFAFTLILYNICNLFKFGIGGLIIGGILTVAMVASSMIPISSTEYMSGGGLTLDKWLYRRIMHKMNKCVYIKHFQSDVEYILDAEAKRDRDKKSIEREENM